MGRPTRTWGGLRLRCLRLRGLRLRCRRVPWVRPRGGMSKLWRGARGRGSGLGRARPVPAMCVVDL